MAAGAPAKYYFLEFLHKNDNMKNRANIRPALFGRKRKRLFSGIDIFPLYPFENSVLRRSLLQVEMN